MKRTGKCRCEYLSSVILVIILSLNFLIIEARTQNAETTDFFLFYHSAQCFLNGESIYTPAPAKIGPEQIAQMTERAIKEHGTTHRPFPNMNSPTHTLLTLPLALLPLELSLRLWSILCVVFGLMAIKIIATTLKSQDATNSNFAPLAILLFSYFPTIANEILGGQCGLLLLLFVAWIWRNARSEKSLLTGLILGIALSAKIIFGIYLVFFLFRKNWAIVTSALIVFAMMNVVGFALFGPSAYEQHLANMQIIPKFLNGSWNASPTAYFARIFGGATNTPLIAAPHFATATVTLISITLLGAMIRSALNNGKDRPLEHFDMGYSLATLGMLALSPVGWVYYFPVLALPLYVAWTSATRLQHPTIYRTYCLIFWLLSTIPSKYIPPTYKEMDNPVIWFTSAGHYFYALMGTCVLLVVMSTKIARRTGGSARNLSEPHGINP